MDRTAVFVDAGYLIARACACAGKAETRRQFTTLKLERFKDEIVAWMARSGAPPLLRIYWYDGLPPSRTMSSDQSAIALADDFKLRLGQVNGLGQQKGVDAMIITDMIELARNKAISDAILIGGDDDLRVGVQVTQTFGVRVHLLGLGADSARSSLNLFLRHEADRVDTWNELTASALVDIREPVTPIPPPVTALESETGEVPGGTAIMGAVSGVIGGLSPAQRQAIDQHKTTSGANSIPSDIDRDLLRACSEALGGAALNQQQKRFMRRQFNSELPALPPVP